MFKIDIGLSSENELIKFNQKFREPAILQANPEYFSKRETTKKTLMDLKEIFSENNSFVLVTIVTRLQISYNIFS
jgi:hypothetical protein